MDLLYLAESSVELPLSADQKTLMYDSVLDNLTMGDWEGHYTERGIFHVEYFRKPEGQQLQRLCDSYIGTLDTCSQTIDFEFSLIFFQRRAA